MKRKYVQVDSDEIEVDFNVINELITKLLNDENIKIVDN
jgi:hypothetical protein|tara:strand:- start:4083 stop:4199 length:117 start_codon:yes stop_codon:yes gene_type:complete